MYGVIFHSHKFAKYYQLEQLNTLKQSMIIPFVPMKIQISKRKYKTKLFEIMPSITLETSLSLVDTAAMLRWLINNEMSLCVHTDIKRQPMRYIDDINL